jgi:serine/threonine protein kinase
MLVAGRYRLEEVLGRGGMGVVWRAVDTLIERTVALKELRPPAGDESSSSTFVERALREARNAGRLSHPGIVAVHDVVAPTSGDDPVVYIVMEHVPAPSLAEVIDRQGPLPPDRVAAMGLGILDALTAAHAIGVVHRDVKPGNVLVTDGEGGADRVKLWRPRTPA